MTQTDKSIAMNISNMACSGVIDKLQCSNKITELVATSSKEDAIAFGEWLNERAKNYLGICWQIGDYTKYTTSELYDIYSADKKKEEYELRRSI